MSDPYSIPFEDFGRLRPWRFNRVEDVAALNRLIAREVVDALKRAASAKRPLMVICPVGPLDYGYWAELMNRERTDGRYLIVVNMDEYVDEQDRWIDPTHPLSFRRFMKETFFDRLEGEARVPTENYHCPRADRPEETTRLIEVHGGADLCYGGMGITGHFAFNDPPEPSESGSVPMGSKYAAHATHSQNASVRESRTRVLTISRESQTQMCMGGTGGNWDIIPRRAVTLGMHELLLSKKIHLTFMRSWHAGVLRRALFGPISARCPGSFVQEHSKAEVTLTELAAQLPLVHVAQQIAE